MFCPGCRSEFPPGLTHCPDCGLPLVDRLPGDAEGGRLTAMRPVLLRSVSDAVEAEMLMELLRGQGVSCLRKYRGAGGILVIGMGSSVFGTDLYVDEADLPAARALLSDWDSRRPAAEPEDEAPEPKTSYFKRPGAAMRVFLLLSALLALAALLYSAGAAAYALLHR